MSEKYKYAIGIDLGTTNSSLCYKDLSRDDSEFILLPLEQKFPNQRVITDTKLPSVVFIKGNETYVGLGAEEKKYSAVRDVNVFYSSKSQLGQKHLYHRSKSGDYTQPYQISGLILKTLLNEFQSNVYPEISECKIVITVPASFGGSQRADTKKAIEYADIKYEEGMLVDEPNSAFVGFIHQSKDFDCPKSSKILVFDMGGGTTDISIIEANSLKKGNLDLRNLAVSRYDLMGGDDIDSHIAHSYLFLKFLEQNQLKSSDFSHSEKDKIVISRLKKVAKSLKEAFSNKLLLYLDQSNINIDKPIDWESIPGLSELVVKMPDETIKVKEKKHSLKNVSLNFSSFNELMNPFLSLGGDLDKREIGYNRLSISPIINRLLEVAELTPTDIDYVLPIGGSPQNALILSSLKTYFADSVLIRPVNLDLLVAIGAALYSQEKALKAKDIIRPIIPESIGIITMGDQFTPIIKAGVEVPFPSNTERYKISEVFVPPKDSDYVSIPICIGSKSRIYDTIKIRQIDLGDTVKIGMKLDADKMLKVKIYSREEEINFTFENPVTVYVSSNPIVSTLNQSFYEYQKAVLKGGSDTNLKQYSLINDLMEAKRFEEALQHCQALLGKTHNSKLRDDLLFKSAYNSSVLEQNDQAIKYYKQLLEKNPEHSSVLLNLGIKYYSLNDNKTAVDLWQRSIDNGNSNPATKISLGRSLMELGESEENAKRLIKEGIRQIEEKRPDCTFDFHWVVTGYKLLEMKNEQDYWKLAMEEFIQNQAVSYDSKELLKQEIEEVEL